jgi:HEAT repeat protein
MQATEHASRVARHVAQFVWLLREEPRNIDDQKTSLRALVAEMKHGHVLLDVSEGHLTANGVPSDDVSACVHVLLTQLAAHGFDAIALAERTPPKALLDVARHLASTPLDEESEDLFDAWPVCLIRHDPAAVDATTLELPEMTVVDPVPTPAPVPTLVATRPAPLSAPPARLAHAVNGFTGSLFDHFATRSGATSAQLAELLRKLDAASERSRLEAVLGRLSVHVEEAVASGDTDLACAILCRIGERALRLDSDETDRVFMLTIRRLARGRLVRAIASRLPSVTAERKLLLAILARAGEEGADAVIEQLVEATDRGHRRVYFDTLTHLKSGVTSLIHMLGDPQWFVVRNAAELLGRIGAQEAEEALCGLLTHDDERVRGSATAALMQLGTARGRAAVIEALDDSAPTVRLCAAGALAMGSPTQMAPPLLRALEHERDDEVQAAFLVALGRLATPEAVERLVAYAQPSRGLFKRNAVSVRLAAIQALGHVAAPIAHATLQVFGEELDDEIGEAARDALTAHGVRPVQLSS